MAKRKAGAGNSINMQDLARVGADVAGCAGAARTSCAAQVQSLVCGFTDVRVGDG